MNARLFSFHGGIKPAAHKDESSAAPIRPAPLPSRLVVPLRQGTRATARCLVETVKNATFGSPGSWPAKVSFRR